MINRTSLWVGGIGLALGGAIYLGVLLKGDQGEDLTKQFGLKELPNAQVDLAVTLRNERGEDVKLSSLLKGRPVVLNMIFYSCRNTCPRQLEGMLRAFRKMKVDHVGEAFDAVTVSIHPKETHVLAAKKKQELVPLYAASRPPKSQHAADKGWHFMTSDLAEATKLAESVGIKYTYNEAKGTVVHPTVLVLLTADGRVSSYFEGEEFPNPLLRNAIVDAGNNVIAGPSETISLLGCFTYDTKTGKAMFHVQRATQLLGALTLIAMIVSIVSMNRRFRQEQGEVGTDA